MRTQITAWGTTQSIAAWAKDPRCVVGYQTLYARLRAGWTPVAAMKSPPAKTGRPHLRRPWSSSVEGNTHTRSRPAWVIVNAANLFWCSDYTWTADLFKAKLWGFERHAQYRVKVMGGDLRVAEVTASETLDVSLAPSWSEVLKDVFPHDGACRLCAGAGEIANDWDKHERPVGHETCPHCEGNQGEPPEPAAG